MTDQQRYGATFSTFWTGDTGRALRRDPDAQRVAFYLITAPGANMLGLYYLALPTLAHEVGLSEQGAREALGRVSALGFAHYDEAAEMVWVVEMARFQLLETARKRLTALSTEDNRLPAIRRLYANARKCRFLRAFFEKYGSALHLDGARGEPPASPLEAPPEGLGPYGEAPSMPLRAPSPTPTPSPTPSPTPTPAPPSSLRSDSPPPGAVESVGNGASPRRPKRPRSHVLTGELAVWFNTVFWPTYPRKEAKTDAERALAKLAPDPTLRQRIVQAIAWQRARGCLEPHVDGKSGRSTVPHPASWLNGQRWLDEPPETAPDGAPDDRDRLDFFEQVPEGTPGAQPAPGGGFVRVLRPGDPGYPKRRPP